MFHIVSRLDNDWATSVTLWHVLFSCIWVILPGSLFFAWLSWGSIGVVCLSTVCVDTETRYGMGCWRTLREVECDVCIVFCYAPFALECFARRCYCQCHQERSLLPSGHPSHFFAKEETGKKPTGRVTWRRRCLWHSILLIPHTSKKSDCFAVTQRHAIPRDQELMYHTMARHTVKTIIVAEWTERRTTTRRSGFQWYVSHVFTRWAERQRPIQLRECIYTQSRDNASTTSFSLDWFQTVPSRGFTIVFRGCDLPMKRVLRSPPRVPP